MSDFKYLPSVHDENEIWVLFDAKLKAIKSLPVVSRRDFCRENGGVDHSCSTTQEAKPPATCQASNLLEGPDYRPLDAFSAAPQDHGSAMWSETDEICELSVRLKEIELCEMMQDAPQICE